MEIPLRNKHGDIIAHTIVSAEDYEHLNQYKWNLSAFKYSTSSDLGRMNIYIAKHLMKLHIPHGYIVDHVNNDKLNNQRENLRVIHLAANSRNMKRKRTNTIYSHIYPIANSTKWDTHVKLNGKRIGLGVHETEMEAARAFDCWLFHHPEKDTLGYNYNFPGTDYSNEIPFVKKVPKNPYYGVGPSNSKFVSKITVDKKRIRLGLFDSAVDAAKAYDKEIVSRNLKRKLNFPEDYPNHDIRVVRIQKVDLPNGIHVQLINDNEEINKANIRISAIDYDSIKDHSLALSGNKRPQLVKNGEKVCLLYRFLLGVDDPLIWVNHYPDGDVYNNTRENLVISNAQKNGEFKRKQEGRTYNGVSKKDYGYTAIITKAGKFIYYVKYRQEEYAARARDLFLLENPQYTYEKNFTDWDEPGIREEWINKLKK